jgi:Helix-turn-helix domain
MIDAAEIAAFLRAQAADLLRKADEIEAETGKSEVTSDLPQIDVKPIWIGTHMAARILGVEMSTVYKLARAGKITGSQGESGLWAFDRGSVEQYATRRRPYRAA